MVVSRTALIDNLRVSSRDGPLNSESLRLGIVMVVFGCDIFADADFNEISRRKRRAGVRLRRVIADLEVLDFRSFFFLSGRGSFAKILRLRALHIRSPWLESSHVIQPNVEIFLVKFSPLRFLDKIHHSTSLRNLIGR